MNTSARQHAYACSVTWTGNLGTGTSTYRAYSRDHEITAPGRPVIAGSADPAFRGDPARYNPEELLLAALASCHMLWYLHLCADAGIRVVEYRDDVAGTMVERPDGGGHFEHAVLRPRVIIGRGDDAALAAQLHQRAHELCFIANSIRFSVGCEPTIVEEAAAGTSGPAAPRVAG